MEVQVAELGGEVRVSACVACPTRARARRYAQAEAKFKEALEEAKLGFDAKVRTAPHRTAPRFGVAACDGAVRSAAVCGRP